jgi:hypothetical protein
LSHTGRKLAGTWLQPAIGTRWERV